MRNLKLSKNYYLVKVPHWLLWSCLLLAVVGIQATCNTVNTDRKLPTIISQAPNYEALAFRYAPIHYQDTDDSNSKADYLTRIDFDNNWSSDDNWDHLYTGDLSAAVYYSVSESGTHWFIIYAFFHPRDWTDHAFDQEHENDLEGILVFVRKNNVEFGELEGMITVFHSDFYSYTPAGGKLRSRRENIDGTISMQLFQNQLHPKTCQQAKGHGLKAWPFTGDFRGDPDEDGVIYFPSKKLAETPSSGNDRQVFYQLVDLHGPRNLWSIQLSEATQARETAKTFASWGSLKGDKSDDCGKGMTVLCSTDAANAPWHWDDSNDGSVFAGEMALDPAHLVYCYFDSVGDFSHSYVYNKYIQDLRDAGYSNDFLPRGWPKQLDIEQLYAKILEKE